MFLVLFFSDTLREKFWGECVCKLGRTALGYLRIAEVFFILVRDFIAR